MPIAKVGEYKILNITDNLENDLAEMLDDEYEDFDDGEKVCTLKELLDKEVLAVKDKFKLPPLYTKKIII